MAILGGGRASDATLVSEIDNVIQDLELDLAQILGIEPGQTVNASVFGLGIGAGGDGYAVQSDGSLRSILRLTLGQVTTSPNTSCGFEFDDTSEKYRIVIVDGELRVYQDVDDVWTLINTLSVPLTKFTELDDVSIVEGDLADSHDYRVAVDALSDPANPKFVIVPVAEGEATNILDAPDMVAPLPGFVGQHLTLLDLGDEEYFVGYEEPPTGGTGDPLYLGDLSDCPQPGVPNPPEAANAGAVLMQGYEAENTIMKLMLPIVAGAGGTAAKVGPDTWVPVLFSSVQSGYEWVDGIFTPASQNIALTEPGFYLVKYVMEFPSNIKGSKRAFRLVTSSGGGGSNQLGDTWNMSPSFKVVDGEIRASGRPLIALDFIRVTANQTLHLEVLHDAAETSMNVIGKLGIVKIR